MSVSKTNGRFSSDPEAAKSVLLICSYHPSYQGWSETRQGSDASAQKLEIAIRFRLIPASVAGKFVGL